MYPNSLRTLDRLIDAGEVHLAIKTVPISAIARIICPRSLSCASLGAIMTARNIGIFMAIAALAGCSNPAQTTSERQTRANARICLPVPPQGKGSWYACLHRMAYRYARAADPAEIVAKAVAVSCGQQIAEQINAAAPDDRVELNNEIMGSVDSLALSKVIEARAGNCDVPN